MQYFRGHPTVRPQMFATSDKFRKYRPKGQIKIEN